MKKKILKIVLGVITRRIIKKYNPTIIAVTGSVGKTSTKNAIALFLEKYFKVRKSAGNLNTEFGVPLVFMGKESGGGGFFWEWFKIISFGIKIIIAKEKDYPKIVVVEMGADKPGDIAYLTKLIKPHIAIVTLISENPVHLGNYKNLDELVYEKSQIVRCLGVNDFAVLNSDDRRVRLMKNETNAKILYFGSDDGSDVRISDINYRDEKGVPKGMIFTVNYKNQRKIIHMPFCFGKGVAYSIAAALSCGITLGLNLDRAAEIFRELKPEKGRMNLIEGKNGSYILDDTYNASPSSIELALKTLASMSARKRIVVLGDMKELGSASQKLHEKIGDTVFGLADILITVGEETKKIKERAIELGFNADNAYHFENSRIVGATLKEVSGTGDLILIKGSQSMRMEKIVESIMKEPQRMGELLTRQEVYWKNKK